MSNFRRKLLSSSIVKTSNTMSCFLYMPLTNGDMKVYNNESNTSFNADYSKYLSSNSEGTTFNKTKGHGVYFINTSLLDRVKSFSIEVKLDVPSGSVSTSWGGIGFLFRNGIYCFGLGDQPNNNRYLYTATARDGNTRDQYVTTGHTRNQWHKICIVSTFDMSKAGSWDNYSVGMYIDGQYISTYTSYSHYYINYQGNTRYFMIGNSWRLLSNGPNSTNINPFCGTVRNLRIFDRTLTAEEALAETI